MQAIYRNQYRRYTLLFDAAEDVYWLSVFCGRIDLHNAQVKLSLDQARAYREVGPSTLDSVAERIREEENAREIPVVVETKRRSWWSAKMTVGRS